MRYNPELEYFTESGLVYLNYIEKFMSAYKSYDNRVEINGKHRISSLIKALDTLNMHNLVTSHEKEAKDISEKILRSRNETAISIFLIP